MIIRIFFKGPCHSEVIEYHAKSEADANAIITREASKLQFEKYEVVNG